MNKAFVSLGDIYIKKLEKGSHLYADHNLVVQYTWTITI